MTFNEQVKRNKDGEEWRAIPGYEGLYEVSSFGRVRRLAGSPKCTRARLLAQAMTTSGYPFVTLSAGGIVAQHAIHRLVTLAFLGPSTLWVNHRNGNKSDNRVENLEYTTPQENIRHAFATGLVVMKRGAAHHSAKLDDRTVEAIRADYAAGVTRRDLMKKYGVGKTTIQGVVTGRTWSSE